VSTDPVNEEPLKCSVCGTPLEECFGRNMGLARQAAKLQDSDKWWRIDHGRHPNCSFRYETFGCGETKEEAWREASQTILDLKQSKQ
jgi:hypothetical protein